VEFVDTQHVVPSPALRGRPSREREGGKIGRLFLDRYFALLLLFAFLAVLTCSPAAAVDEKEKLIAFLKEINAVVDEDGVSVAVNKIESQGDTNKVMRSYFIVTNHFYRSKKDITKMLAFGEAAMAYLLDQAEKASKNDVAQADKLKGLAKSMAYNISVNAWPGWNEKGIKITREHSKAAMHAARENLRLGIELKRPADVMGNAHWLIGAQHLAAEQPDKAIEQFKKAVDQFSTAKKPDYQHMAEGYIGITQLTQAATRDRGRRTLDKALTALKARKTTDAKFFASQLKSVENVFVDASAN
jgi:hypothetical protein